MRRPLHVSLVAILLALTAAGAGADELTLIDGRTITGIEVQDETYESVEYTIMGSKQVEPARNVASVKYDRQPSSYREGLALMEAGRFTEAAERFADTASDRRRAWTNQYGLFYQAECLRLGGDPSGAARIYAELLEEHPKTRFYPAASVGLGLTLAAKGDHEGARKAFADLAREAKRKNLGDQWELEAELQVARTYEAEGDRTRASRKYQELSSTRVKSRYPEIGYAAELGELRTSDLGSRAIDRLERLIDEEKTPANVRAGAYVALGNAFAADGEHKRALLAYLRVVLDPPLAGAPAARAEALFKAAQAFEQVKTQDWRERAEGLRQELREKYPSSTWAQQL